VIADSLSFAGFIVVILHIFIELFRVHCFVLFAAENGEIISERLIVFRCLVIITYVFMRNHFLANKSAFQKKENNKKWMLIGT